MTTDASMEGWGGHSTINGQDLLFSGLWSREEARHCHINLLELRAIRLTLSRLQSHLQGKVVRVECDNTTAVSNLNKQGGGAICLDPLSGSVRFIHVDYVT